MAKTKRLTQIRAGRLVRVVCYKQAVNTDEPQVRAAKSKCSSEARQRINARTSRETCEEVMAANFDRGDLFLTLTYREAPSSREHAMRMLGIFLRRLREARAARGERLLYIKNAEHIRDDGTEGRWHHHLVINSTGCDFEEIRELWSSWGDNVDFEGLLSDGESYESRARYLCKERPPLGKQCWTPSRGMRRPQRSSELVDDSLTITVDSLPAGSVVLEHHEEHNEWGAFVYYKYLLPYRETPPRPRRRGDGGP